MAPESDMQREFGYSERPVNADFRFFRIDAPARPGQNSEMGKKNKKLAIPAAGAPLWYAGEWLVLLKVKQTDLAGLTGYTNSQVSEWVTGAARFNARVLHRFAKALKIHPSDLLLPPGDASDELIRLVRGLDKPQRERALRVLRAADILPPRDKAA